MSTKLNVPDGIKTEVAGDKIIVSGPKGTVERKFPVRNLTIKAAGGEIELSAERLALENTFVAHIRNMLRGVVEPFTYKLKIAYVHFPMTASIQNLEFSITNFLGERRPRKARLPKGVDVKIDGEFITVTSPDIELAGKAATLIEQLTRISARDRRTFLDGIFMVEKPGVTISA